MKMYRAVAKHGFSSEKIYRRQATRRTPSNVPYLVDNIWEWLRPEHAPNRRHSSYSSPTPELALENSSAAGPNRDLYVVCEIMITGNYKLAHLKVTDARYHADISAIVRYVSSFQGNDFSNLPVLEKAKHAALYLPGVSREELNSYLNNSFLATGLTQVSTFWQEASYEPQSHNGELFFELEEGSSYQLIPL